VEDRGYGGAVYAAGHGYGDGVRGTNGLVVGYEFELG
jgi:hypothetical protein